MVGGGEVSDKSQYKDDKKTKAYETRTTSSGNEAPVPRRSGKDAHIMPSFIMLVGKVTKEER